jgi:hypothetical protein
VGATLEIINEMNHQMCRAGLARELKIFARQHVTVKAEAEVQRER